MFIRLYSSEATKSSLHFQEDESAAEFASRVKTEIARQGGLVDLIWYVFSMRCFAHGKRIAK